jgi:YbbR domain-containing protein
VTGAAWWPFRHLGLKLLSVALALLLWMVIAGEETVERGLRIPLELQQFPLDLELNGEPPSLVDARVRGASGMLSRLSSGDVVAVIDLRGAHEGRRLFPLTKDQVRVPFGVEIVQVTPPTVALVFEKRTSKLMPADRTVQNVPVHLTNLAPNLTAQSSPSTVDVNVRGSGEELSRLKGDDISAYVDLAGLGAGPYTLPVRADATHETGVTGTEPAMVQVQITNGKD